MAQDFRRALQEWRNTPRANGFSPAQAFWGRDLRGCLPSLSLPAFDKVAYEEARCKDAKKLVEQHVEKPVLAELAVGDLVSIQDPRLGWWSGRGVIKKIRPSGRSYEVKDLGWNICPEKTSIEEIAYL